MYKGFGYCFVCLILYTACSTKESKSMDSIYKIQERVASICNIPYKVVGENILELDVFLPSKRLGEEPWKILSQDLKPTLIYFHGGGWIEGDRFSRFLETLPYLEKGWAVVNVDYRLLDETNLIGCLKDCLDAINWVNNNADKYKFDVDKIYLSGESAGGHLALLSGMINKETQQKLFSNYRKVNVAGIINWYGITNVKKTVDFWDDAAYTSQIINGWNGEISRYYNLMSPVNYVSQNTPPILSIHGTEDVMCL